MDILLIEDNPVERKLIAAVISRVKGKPLNLQCADTLQKGLDILQALRVDCVLLDLNLPDSSGIETFRRLQAGVPSVPIVVLTVMHDEELALQAVGEGAQDYLFKAQAEGSLLVRAVRYAVERHRMRAELESYTSRLGRHMQLLTRGFSRVARGDFGVRIAGDSDGHDELAALAHGFDGMAEQLQRLSQQKAQFYSMVTHDLRSPIHTILLASGAMEQMRADDAGRAPMVGVVRRKAAQLMQLVDELQEVMFIEGGQMKLFPTRTDLNQLLATCVEDLASQAESRGQRLRLEPVQEDATLTCDSLKIYCVVENLVGNAIRYSVAGDTIVVRASACRPGLLQIDVTDHGPGIGVEEKDRLFEPFFRGRASDAGGRGTGLGLGICHAFVRAHGGSIWVVSEPGQGASFRFEIPRQP
ncbi:MAG: hybrid sensor histidine kinase/response regulator [Candidatus Wallbacteria bacterium]|nr:hybrid sensor histidine kinase/response regulator [Candidatus Wallbacteria bacterium]